MLLSWGDVAVDNPMHPTMLRVKQKCSKTDQLGKGLAANSALLLQH